MVCLGYDVIRHTRYELLQLIIIGKVAGKKGVGRWKKSWMRNIEKWTGIAKEAQLFNLARDREKYAKLTANRHQVESHYEKKRVS